MANINLETVVYKGIELITIVMRVKGKVYYASKTEGWTEDITQNVGMYFMDNVEQAKKDYRFLIESMKEMDMLPKSSEVIEFE